MSPLTDQERSALSDLARFNDGPGRNGWRLAQRSIDNRDLSGLIVTRGTLDQVDFDETTLNRARFTDTKFTQVRFINAKYAGTVFENCDFDRCQFAMGEAPDAIFRNCRFTGGGTSKAKWEKVTVVDCRFSDFDAKELSLEEGAVVERCRWQNCRWYRGSLAGAKVRGWEIIGGSMEGDITWVEATKVRFEGVTLKELRFGDSKLNEFEFIRCTITKSSFGDSQINGLRLSECRGIDEFGVLRGKVRAVVFAKCDGAAQVAFSRTEIDDLRIEDGETWTSFEISESTVRAPAIMRRVTLNNANFEGSKSTGLELEKVVFTGFLNLRAATFTALKLSGVSYDTKLERLNAGTAKFEGGDSFNPK